MPTVRTRFFEVLCIGVPREICDSIARLVERVERVAELVPGVVYEMTERARLGAPSRIVVVWPRLPKRELMRHGVDLYVERMEEAGFVGATFGGYHAVVLYRCEMEAAETAAEEALHIIFGTIAGRGYLHQRLGAMGPLDEWLAEEMLVHELLHRLGVITERDLEEMRRAYEELYRREAGRSPPPGLREKVERLAEELASRPRGGERVRARA